MHSRPFIGDLDTDLDIVFMQEGIAKYDCDCEDGWEGRNCSINIDECNPNPCYNNGTCMVSKSLLFMIVTVILSK